ncbi:hypothetical protein TRVL_02967 [Trypanosoma vivax]|nr:hypothetical protein TRVL_02967 [Trypanosoma vivax]
MDFSATRRGTDPSRRRHGHHFPVVIVGEVFGASSSTHPLAPVVPSEDVPFTLLPICDTPIIDYILENLAQNHVDEVFILLNSVSVPLTRLHLKNSRTARGRPWLECKDMKVHIVESVRTMTRLCDATAEIVEQNVIGQNSPFLFVPIDSLAVFTNLYDLFCMHVERTKTIKNYAATLLCTSVRAALNETLHNVLVENATLRSDGTVGAESQWDSQQVAGRLIQEAERRPLHVPLLPPNHLTLFTLQKSTGVVLSMSRLEERDKLSEPARIQFSEHERTSVRTDLLPTGFLFCSGGSLSLFAFPMADQHAFLVDLLAKHELWGNVFGIAEATAPTCVIRPINSLRTYIQANIDICSRRFFPLTREYRFVEARALYAVSPQCPSVYLHQVGARVLSSACGPFVVVGENVVVPSSVVVRGAVLSKGVSIGEGSVIIGCVLLDGATVGRGCMLRNCFVGCEAEISDDSELSNCVVDNCCVVGAHNAGRKAADGSVVAANGSVGTGKKSSNATAPNPATRSLAVGSCAAGSEGGLILQDVVIVSCNTPGAHHCAFGPGWCATPLVEPYSNAIVPTRELFVRDLVPRTNDGASDLSTDSESEYDNDKFTETVAALVDQALRDPSRIEHYMFQMKNSRLTFGRNNRDLCYVVTERLLYSVLQEPTVERGELLRRAFDLFKQWCRPFYNEVVTGNDEMQAIIEATCTSIGNTKCPLHKCGPALLECIYNNCDDDLYDERGYCIVSGESIVEFGERVSRMVEQSCSSDEDDSDDGDDESLDVRRENMLRVALSCKKFIADVHAFLEEEEEEVEEQP